ncbi:hypothetical protein NBRC111894_2045 [Sporolactobacillus inulinus]|uniref:Uncharacterized protein n=1 Tax=Sporolactobacillus inulinus TaxID=2078 RepID=A0A4Y1ZC29_9BACL|nr:hypothetical protein NBRC111894_2045 [Sporolactobacillus inulinus]
MRLSFITLCTHAGTHQQGAIPRAPEYLRFDSWSRHWPIGLKMGQNPILSFPVKKTLA